MNIHEFQAKTILEKYGIWVPEFSVVASIEDLEKLIQEKGWQSAVLKVQIHAGGRGKAGGVKIARNSYEILSTAKQLLERKIVTSQTDSEGLFVRYLLVSPLIDFVQESYLGMIINREKAQIILLASPIGGIDIEQVAHEQPEKILILPLPSEGEFRPYHFLRLANFMGWKEFQAECGTLIVKAMTKAFKETDATLLEINPLVQTKDGQLLALDAKMVIDDNALYRQPELKALFDFSQIHPNEVLAQQHELAYISLNGDIGCMVNGAGLAMGTMDLIHHFGGHPANFLDVGGGATKEKIAEGFKIILSDPKVKAILVNIFGGIMNCATLAEGIIKAVKDLHLNIPLIVRLEGTNVEKGKELLKESDLNIISVDDLTQAAEKAVRMAQKSGI